MEFDVDQALKPHKSKRHENGWLRETLFWIVLCGFFATVQVNPTVAVFVGVANGGSS